MIAGTGLEKINEPLEIGNVQTLNAKSLLIRFTFWQLAIIAQVNQPSELRQMVCLPEFYEHVPLW